MYLIIDKQYRVYQSHGMDSNVRSLCRQGKVSVINLTTMQGMNSERAQLNGLKEYSDVQGLPPDFKA